MIMISSFCSSCLPYPLVKSSLRYCTFEVSQFVLRSWLILIQAILLVHQSKEAKDVTFGKFENLNHNKRESLHHTFTTPNLYVPNNK